jgi:hypothetical protein
MPPRTVPRGFTPTAPTSLCGEDAGVLGRIAAHIVVGNCAFHELIKTRAQGTGHPLSPDATPNWRATLNSHRGAGGEDEQGARAG